MDFDINFTIERSKQLISNVKNVWRDIEDDGQDAMWHIGRIMLPWALLSAVFGYVIEFIFGYAGASISVAIAEPLVTVGVVFGGAFVLEKLADNYTPTSKDNFLIVLAYASVPLFVGQAFGGLISIVSIFSLVILWYGFEARVHITTEKKIGFFILSAIILLLLQTIAQAIVVKLLGTGMPIYIN